MRNRDKYLLKRNEYDVLCEVQLALLHGENCILDALTAHTHSCKANTDKHAACCECIQEWLNKEE
jgi:hypothetical protein